MNIIWILSICLNRLAGSLPLLVFRGSSGEGRALDALGCQWVCPHRPLLGPQPAGGSRAPLLVWALGSGRVSQEATCRDTRGTLWHVWDPPTSVQKARRVAHTQCRQRRTAHGLWAPPGPATNPQTALGKPTGAARSGFLCKVGVQDAKCSRTCRVEIKFNLGCCGRSFNDTERRYC